MKFLCRIWDPDDIRDPDLEEDPDPIQISDQIPKYPYNTDPRSLIWPTSRVDMTCGGAANNNNEIRFGFLSFAAVVYPGRDLGVMLHFWKVITQLWG